MPNQILERPIEIFDFITVASGATETKTYPVPAHWKWKLTKVWIDRAELTDYTIIIDGKRIEETNVMEFTAERIAYDSVTLIVKNNRATAMQYDIVIAGTEISK
jgi:hypothetical protein